MIRVLLALALLVCGGIAHAQPVPVGPCMQSASAGCSYAGPQKFSGTITGPDSGTWSSTGISATGANVTGAGGYQQYGTTILKTQNGAVGYLAVGNTAPCGSITASSNEDTCLGNWVAPWATTAIHDTWVGIHSGGYEIGGSYNTFAGDDAERNAQGVSSSVGIGNWAYGNYFGQGSNAVGFFALAGNAASILLTGTPTNGDTESLTFTTTAIASPETVTINITTGETIAQRQAAFAAAINADSVLLNVPGPNASISALTDPTSAGVIAITFNNTSAIGSATLVVTHSATGSATETATITGGVTATAKSNYAYGYKAMLGLRMTSASYNVGIASYSLANLTTGAGNVCGGDLSCQYLTTDQNSTTWGYETLANAAGGGSGNTMIGAYQGFGITTGGFNLGLGICSQLACYNQVTTGSGNVWVGGGAAVQSATANWQLSIMNAIYGANNSGQGASLSTGCIGFYTASCSGTSTVVIAGPLLVSGLTSDAGKSDATVCDVTASGTLYYGSGTGGICLTTSSARFKTDIAPEREGLTQLMALHPMSFNYKPGHGYDPGKRYNGFIAEQMAPVLPELVGHDDLGLPNSVDLMGLVPILVQSVQQQQREIWELGAVCLLLALWCGGMTVMLAQRH